MHSIITKPTPTPLTNTPYALCVVAGRRGYRVWRRRRVCLEEEEWTGAAPGPPGWCLPGFPDEKSLPAFAATDPVPNYCKLQQTSTDSATFFIPGLRLQVSSVVGVLFTGALRSTAGR